MKDYVFVRNINVFFILCIILAFLLNQNDLGIYEIIAYAGYSTYSALRTFGIITPKKKSYNKKKLKKAI